MKIDHKPGSEIMAVTGENGRQILLNAKERRALLDHLLDTDGLPGVEEIEGLRRKMEKVGFENVYLSQRNQEMWADRETVLTCLGINYDPDYGYYVECDPGEQLYPTLRDAVGAVVMIDNAEKNDLRRQLSDAEAAASGMSRDLTEMGENAESTIDKLMGELAESRRLHQDMCAEVESLSKLVFDTRQSRLTELLEEQARERVHAIPFGENVRFENSAGHGASLTHRKGVYGFCLPGFETNEKHAEAIFWGLAAALAEKRRRESEDLVAACEYCEATTTDPETPGWHWDDDAIWTCPKCTAECMAMEDNEDPALTAAFIDQLRNAPPASDDNLSDLMESEVGE